MKIISGGVCAAKGFKASGVHCGIRKNRTKRDLALIYSEKVANAAAVYTTNLVKGAPLIVTKNHIADGKAQAVICNSGNANTCNANGVEIAERTSDLLASVLGIKPADIVVASTGVIGQPLNITPIASGIPALKAGLGDHSDQAAEAIMTTDTIPKEIAVSFEIGGVECKMGGIAKGSGMIHPNMATMLVFITTDCAISSEMLQKALSSDIAETFNMISIDGDTSTNDMVTVLANGLAGNKEISKEGDDFNEFMKALNTITVWLCRRIAADGEGATKLLECKVSGAKDKETAKTVAKSVVCSSLTKAAMFGSDANWGRVLCAIGYSGADVDVNKIDVWFKSDKSSILVCENGAGLRPDIRLCQDKRRLPHLIAKNGGKDMNISNAERARVLVHALPYIQDYAGKIVVVKYGGNAMTSEKLKDSVMRDIVLLWLIGIKVVLVHGGGPEITDMLQKTGKKSEFVNGLRVTDKETADIVQMVLAGKVNKSLVNLVENKGGKAMGLSGIDGHMIEAKIKDEKLGFVGEITNVNIQPILDVIDKGYIPIVSTIGCDSEGNVYNINADTAAAKIAGALNAESLISMTDISGILQDKDDPDTLISVIKADEVPALIKSGIIGGGMIPKAECCINAIKWGVHRVFIIDGRIPHSILIEMLTDEGMGTMFTA